MKFMEKVAYKKQQTKFVENFKEFMGENQAEFDSMMETYVGLVNKIPEKYGVNCEGQQESFMALVILEVLRSVDAPVKVKQDLLKSISVSIDGVKFT